MKQPHDSQKMSALELKASASLASIYGLRMLGMFLILPIFAIYASQLPGGENHFLIGLALGAYGLTQALFQLPFGMASDRFGRKPVIYFGLALFALGCIVAGLAHDLVTVAIGRSIQGAGAISAAVTALVADLTREEHRTKAMAMIGGTIAITFALSLILGPILNQWIGVPGIFFLTAGLVGLAFLVVKYLVPNPIQSSFHSDAEAKPARLKEVLKNTQLLRLNYGIFALHAAQMAMFVVVPFAIKKTSGMSENHHWMIYLPILITSFVLMVPAIIVGEKKAKLKQVFVGGIALMLIAQLAFSWLISSFWGIVISLGAYFVAFNILEATLPSIITKIAPAPSKGTAIGVYNTLQSLGVFVGGAMGGFLSHYYSFSIVFAFCGVLMAIWLLLGLTMQAPPAVKSQMFHVRQLSNAQSKALSEQLASVRGVREVAVLAEERLIVLKVDLQSGFDEAAVMHLIGE
jgi:MFS family permease